MRGDATTASLFEDEDVAMFVSLGVAQSGEPPIQGRVIAIIDGVQVNLDGGEGSVAFVPLEVEAGESQDVHLTIPAASIASGAAHTLVVAIISGFSGRLVDGRTFTLFKDGFQFAAGKDDTAAASLSQRTDSIWSPWSNDISLGLYQPFHGVDHDGASIPIDMTVESPRDAALASCGADPIWTCVVALVDGRQVEIGDFGPVLRLALPYAKSARVQTELRNLPLDGAPHALTLLQYRGDGMYSETPAGERLAWYDWFLVDLGFAYWQ
jgi:hypothetical protein